MYLIAGYKLLYKHQLPSTGNPWENWDVGTGAGGGTHAPSYFGGSVITLSQPRGQIGLCPTHYCSPSPIFSDLPTSLEKINFYGLYICMLCLNIRVCVRPFFQICINFKGNLLKTRSLNYKLCLFVLLKTL